MHLDLRNMRHIANNLALIHTFDEKTSMKSELLTNKDKIFANKVLMLTFLKRNFGINKEALFKFKEGAPELKN